MSRPVAAPSNASSTDHAFASLDRDGYVVIEGIGSQDAAESFVRGIGELIPQYSGSLTHHVTYRPGHDHLAYSQSTNTILAHTEAPGWEPSPAYLALYCHRQARCGGGHTDLLDIRAVLERVDDAELALLTQHEMHFPGPLGGTTTRMIAGDGDRTVVRFSYNLLTSADYDPVLAADIDVARLPLGEAGRALARRVSDLFSELRTSVLIPDGALLIWDNQRMLHARSAYTDRARHLTRFWCTDRRRSA